MIAREFATPGYALADVDTPALIVDLDALDANIARMAAFARAAGLRLRPHAKSHKCPAIAQRQVAAGAVGICCQKTDEAAAFVAAGIRDVLVTNEVVAPQKLARLALLARDARIGVLCDNATVVDAIAHAARDAGVVLDVYVEVDVGAHRCGVAPGAPAAALAQRIAATAGLRFAGLHCYQGSAQHLPTPDERRRAIAAAAVDVSATRDACTARGLDAGIVTGAGTGTFELEAASGLWQELQPGSYVFMDAHYARNTRAGDGLAFVQSLYVIAQVMSVPTAERAVCDAGLKALAFDSGLPLVSARPGVTYAKASDEHGVLDVTPGAGIALGDKLRLVPGHCDPTVNLYDRLVAVRGERVEDVWPIARGTLG
ncbi:MAG: DSD1 family PLP-dependent enzyme [Proteobacteria bacterium]|nr:DSD1 family PLP-dependent enzyme [Pseudomonadota bacterium]